MPRFAERHDLLHKRLVRFTQMLQGVADGDARAIHRTRVASRRLREVLPVLQLEGTVQHKLSRRLRKITDRLGVVRELDVLRAVVDELGKTGRYPESALARVGASIEEERRRKRDRLGAKSQMRELRRVASKLEKLAKTLEVEDAAPGRVTERRSWKWAIDARIARRATALATAISKAGIVYLPERLHDVRIAVKKLRYALELSADVAKVKSTPDLTQLRRAQDILGRLHDLHMLTDRTRDAQASLTPPNVNEWRQLDALVGMLEDSCRRLHGRYMKDREGLQAMSSRLAGRAADPRSQKLRARSS